MITAFGMAEPPLEHHNICGVQFVFSDVGKSCVTKRFHRAKFIFCLIAAADPW